MPKFEINNLTKARVDEKFLLTVAKKTCKSLPRAKREALSQGEISIVLVGDGRIKAINKKYRKKNKVTDVLAFDYGEIFICLPQAKKQAKQLGHSVKKELAILLIHGILHLAGYDDRTKKGRSKMLKKQNQVCEKII